MSQKNNWKKLKLVLVSFIIVSSLNAEKSSLKIGLTPNETSPKIQELENELSRRMNEKVTLYIGKNYEDLAESFKKGSISFAILPPRLAVKLEEQTPLRYLMKKVYGVSDYYYAAILTLKSASTKTLASLKTKKIAFVDKESGSGYLYPRMMLRQGGLSDKDYVESFWGTHEKALEALVNGKVDAAAVWADEPASKRGAWTKFSDSMPKKVSFNVLAYSEPIPNDPLIVREDFYKSNPSKVLRIMETLLALSEESTLLKEVTGADRMTTATKTHFDSVRQLEGKGIAKR